MSLHFLLILLFLTSFRSFLCSLQPQLANVMSLPLQIQTSQNEFAQLVQLLWLTSLTQWTASTRQLQQYLLHHPPLLFRHPSAAPSVKYSDQTLISY